MAYGDGVGAQGAGMGIGLGPPGQSPLAGGSGPSGGGVMPDLEKISKALGYNDSKAIVEAFNRNTIDKDQFTGEFQNLTFPQRVTSAFRLYTSSLNQNKAMTVALKQLGMPLTNAIAMASIGAAISGNVFGQSPDPGPNAGPGGLTPQDFERYLKAGQEYAQENNIEPEKLITRAMDRVAAETLVNQLAPELGGDGRHYIESVDHVLDTLSRGGRDLADMSQGGGLPDWWNQYVRSERPSLLNGGSTLLGENMEDFDTSILGIEYDNGSNADDSSTVRKLYKELFGRDNPGSAEVKFWQDKLDAGELTPETLKTAMQEAAGDWEPSPGGSQWKNKTTGDVVYDSAREAPTGGVDSGLGADQGQTDNERLVRGYYENLFGRSNPDAEGVAYWTKMLDEGMAPEEVRKHMEAEGGDWTDQGDGNWLRDDGLAAQDDIPTDYQFDPNNPQIFKDFVDSFYDQALSEYQKQSGQYQDATDKYEAKSDEALSDQQGMLEDLLSRLTDSTDKYETTQQGNLDQLEGRQNELFDTAKGEQTGYLDRLIGAIDDTNSSNLPRVNRLAGGQQVSYIPRSLRAANNDDRTAELGLFDRSKGFSDTFLNTGTNQAQSLFAGQNDVANTLLNAGTTNARTMWDAGDRSISNRLGEAKQQYGNETVLAGAGNPTLNYLSELQKLVEMEQRRIAAEKGVQLDYDKIASQEEMAEPGMVDYGKAIGTTISTIKDGYDLYQTIFG